MSRYYGYYSRRRKLFDFDNFEITKREIIASISIVAIMMLIGILISGKISENQMDKNEVYNKAIKIESTDLFQHGMNTNVGNAFVYGKLKAVDTVNFPEVDGKYMYIKKVKEKYTMHTRVVTYTVNGKTHTRTETYWTWDYVDSESKKSKEVTFCGVKFATNKINIPSSSYIKTIKESSRIRYVYYGVKANHKGTIFTELKNNTIADNTNFYKDKTIEETLENITSSGKAKIIVFWVFWVILIGFLVFVFYYIDNKWLEEE